MAVLRPQTEREKKKGAAVDGIHLLFVTMVWACWMIRPRPMPDALASLRKWIFAE